MDETDLISGLVDYLDANLSAAVRTTGFEEERPLPVVVIDMWDTEDLHFHNSHFAGYELADTDMDDQQEYVRYYRYYFQTRVDFIVREDDEVEANQLMVQLKSLLRKLGRDPQQLNSDLNTAKVLGSGQPDHTFTEPKETEFNVSARFFGFFQTTESFEAIQEVTKTFTITE